MQPQAGLLAALHRAPCCCHDAACCSVPAAAPPCSPRPPRSPPACLQDLEAQVARKKRRNVTKAATRSVAGASLEVRHQRAGAGQGLASRRSRARPSAALLTALHCWQQAHLVPHFGARCPPLLLVRR